MPTKDKELNRQRVLACYRKNKQRFTEYDKKRKQQIKAKINAIKQSKGCIVCGEKHPGCLDFHHRDKNDKINQVSTLAHKGCWWKIEAEIEKCDVLCANCHRKKHWEETNDIKDYPQP